MSVSAAKSRVVQAQSYLESRRYDEVEAVLDAATTFLTDLPDAETATVRGEIATLRATAAEAAQAERYGTKVRAAERELRVARSDTDSGYVMPSGILDRIDKALGYVDDVPDAVKASIIAEATDLRARLRGEAPAPEVVAEPEPAAARPSDDEAAALSRARGIILGARSRTESGRTDGVTEALRDAGELLTSVRDVLKAQLIADMEAIRAAATEADAAENTRRVTSELDRHFSQAENGQAWRLNDSARAIAHLTERLADDDVRTVLAPDMLTRYRNRLADAITARDVLIKDNAVERATPILAELEEAVGADPFVGLGQDEAYGVATRLRSLKGRVLGELSPAPDGDPDVRALLARVAATDRIVATADAAWALANLEAAVVNRWRAIRDANDDWRSEAAAMNSGRVEAPRLPKTEQAMRELGFWLGDADAVRIRDGNVGNETIAAAYRAGQEAYDAAAAKLNLAYVHVLDEADKLPSPTLERELDVLEHFSSAIDSVFSTSSYRDGLLTRVGQIRNRWRADYDAMIQARKELYDRLSVEADAAWPGIVAATGATGVFETGNTVLLSGVYNRAGWEFNGYGFCMRYDGVPVGGSYEPHVLRALEHAWYELKLDVNDRITWDVVGVVEGPGKIAERTEVTVRDRSTGLEIGKLEQWPSVDCVRLRIIALHAGPVAVGP